MSWSHYDQGTGYSPRIGDKIESCHFGKNYEDGFYKGVFAGWSSMCTGIMILDKPAPTGELAIAMPVVCMRLIPNTFDKIIPAAIPRQNPLIRY